MDLVVVLSQEERKEILKGLYLRRSRLEDNLKNVKNVIRKNGIGHARQKELENSLQNIKSAQTKLGSRKLS